MSKFRILIVTLFLALSTSLAAQIYSVGDDPGHLKWSQLNTTNYRLIYPRGLDSLARVYAQDLENYRHAVGASAGFLPNGTYKKPQPVILHAYTANANGVVTWMPRRMDLFTVPDAYFLQAIPNQKILAIHESRHVTQMQFGHANTLRPFHYLVGDLAEGAFCGLFLGQTFMEGDAVATETALTRQGRGRSADFLEYYRAAFAAGDMRDYYKWEWTSMKRYTPDYYAAGYMLVAGMRHVYSDSLFTSRLLNNASKHPVKNLFAIASTIKEKTGYYTKRSFDSIAVGYKERWAAETVARGPFMPMESMSKTPRLHKEYKSLCLVGDKLYSLRDGVDQPKEIIEQDLKTGNIRHIGAFAINASNLRYSKASDRLYWSESTSSGRWSLAASSTIRYLDLKTEKRGKLTSKGRLYHPAPSGNGEIAVSEYPIEGGSSVEILSEEDGALLRRYLAPGEIQVVETCWIDDAIYASGISDEGFGIYRVDDGFSVVAEPQPLQISRLWSRNGKIMFSCDRTGVEELYAIDPGRGKIEQITNTEFGALDYQIDGNGEYLYYSSLTTDGRLVYRTPVDSLPVKEIKLEDRHLYADAESLTAQDSAIPVPANIDYEIGETKPYHKASHLMKFHSWAPIFVNYDAVSAMSFDHLYEAAGIGATAMFQNDLGTMYGTVGYEWAQERHGGYARLTYTGLYPVIEAQIQALGGIKKGYLYTYIPVNLSSGGWTRGLIPSARYTWNPKGENVITASVRAYSMRPATNSCVYPRWGIGGELGYSSLNQTSLAYLYGYVPGIIPQQGLRLSALVQSTKSKEEPYWGRLTADYSISFAPMDWSGFSGLAQVRNLELTLHAMEYLYKEKSRFVGGATLAVRLNNFIVIPYDTRIGVQVLGNKNGMQSSLVFTVDL